MARFCNICNRSFPTQRGFQAHCTSHHRHPKPKPLPRVTQYHPLLSARPCNAEGEYLEDMDAPPPPRDIREGFDPFPNRPSFEVGELLYEKMAASKGDLEQLFRILHAQKVLDGHNAEDDTFFSSHQHLLDTIDAIPCGDSEWTTFVIRYAGPIPPNAPKWQKESYVVHAHNSRTVVENMASNPDFDGSWNTRPYREFDEHGTRIYSNLLSAHWSWKQADLIAQDPETHGAMFVPLCIAADKTTASVATGNQEFHPVYLMAGNVTNEMRRAHRDAVVPVAFLPIPKAEAEYANSTDFRLFKKQVYHLALRLLLDPLRPGMTTPQVLRCPDGHFRRSIFGIGPVIADYPEQVYLSGIVQGWCPKCQALPDELDSVGVSRSRAHTCELWETYMFDPGTLWDSFGIVNDVTPFTYHFPRADIHELLTPDLLHQLIKGTFKDHLVDWVVTYIRLNAATEREANQILDDIDRRIAASPAFPGLRRFPQGRNFKQWTGNDSKALMKVFLPALSGYVPDAMIQCLAAFFDFAYLARRPSHNTTSLDAMDAALARFRQLRVIFVETGVRPDGFSLPRQHALLHYTRMIKLFGSPNGVCTSISESKHIAAVKRPWRASSRHKPLLQILIRNTRLSKLAAFRVELGRCGLLHGDIVSHALHQQNLEEEHFMEEQDIADAHGPHGRVSTIAQDLQLPGLHALIRRFLREQLYPGVDDPDEVVPLDICPWVPHSLHVGVHRVAKATFFAPSEFCGSGGMHSEAIRCTPQWRQEGPRYDTVFVQLSDDPGMHGMGVARVRGFLSFTYDFVLYQCALVEWFEIVGDEPDPVMGMWVVEPDIQNGERAISLISIDSIVRSCHLIGVYGHTRIPNDFCFSDTLDAFRRYYVNPYADYHINELLK
ncbi:hypothetical protein GY45DRAFT_1264667 [Cubamyces sp. BRFM 1775]|nr:hypothetical protein GY45DRAFT_1264667 [Cubamyces sp. BRFM 1775]